MSACHGKGLLAAAAIACAQPCSAVEVAPYFQSWSHGSLLQARQAAGLDHAVFAFGITNGSCHLQAPFVWKLGEARRFVEAGGKLVVSMGGAEGVYAEAACSDAQLLALLQHVMERTGTRRLDWDIEGRHVGNAEANVRRARVLARLQAMQPDLHTSFTLASRLRGLTAESLQMLKTTLAHGARVDRINVMTMAFGGNAIAALSPPTAAQASMLSFQAAARQIADLYPDLSRGQLHAMMGITPMIGANDDDTTFTLADARTVADFARDNGIGFISYWAFQRDRIQDTPGLKPLGAYSGVVQSNYQFYRIFRSIP